MIMSSAFTVIPGRTYGEEMPPSDLCEKGLEKSHHWVMGLGTLVIPFKTEPWNSLMHLRDWEALDGIHRVLWVFIGI